MKLTTLSLSYIIGLALYLAAVSAFADGHGKHNHQASNDNLAQVVLANPDFSVLAQAIEAAELKQTLAGDGPFTLFAPTNAAFDKLPPGTLDSLLKPENKAQLVEVLSHHLVTGRFAAESIAKQSSFTTLQGDEVAVSQNYFIKIAHARVTSKDLNSTNGVVHGIDQVLLPQAIDLAYRPRSSMMDY